MVQHARRAQTDVIHVLTQPPARNAKMATTKTPTKNANHATPTAQLAEAQKTQNASSATQVTISQALHVIKLVLMVIGQIPPIPLI